MAARLGYDYLVGFTLHFRLKNKSNFRIIFRGATERDEELPFEDSPWANTTSMSKYVRTRLQSNNAHGHLHGGTAAISLCLQHHFARAVPALVAAASARALARVRGPV